MSSVRVRVMRIDEVLPHPDADRLSVLKIGGYQTCTAKHNLGTDEEPDWRCPYEAGDEVFYVPPDAMVPEDVAEAWGVTDYLGKHGRVKTVKLRGFVSRGFAVPVEPIKGEFTPALGDDVTDHYGITKYEPPQPSSNELEPEHPRFTKYTDIERLQNYPDIFEDGEEIVVTEKIHGTNSRVGSLMTEDGPILVCGTRRNQVKRGQNSKYEFPLQIDEVLRLLAAMREEYPDADSVVLFGEVFGQGVQGHFTYGYEQGEYGYRAFDIAIDGDYLNWDDFKLTCENHGVPIVPILYRGPFSVEKIEALSDGETTFEKGHVREGVVFKPVEERWDGRLGRVILKRIGDSYEINQYDWTDSH